MNLTEGTQCMRVCAVVVAKCKVAATIKGNPDFTFRYCQNSYKGVTSENPGLFYKVSEGSLIIFARYAQQQFPGKGRRRW